MKFAESWMFQKRVEEQEFLGSTSSANDEWTKTKNLVKKNWNIWRRSLAVATKTKTIVKKKERSQSKKHDVETRQHVVSREFPRQIEDTEWKRNLD